MAQVTFDRERIALMFEITAEVCRNAALRAFVQAKRSEIKDALVERLVKKGFSRRKAARMIEHLELLSAIASGAAVHCLLYSDGSPEGSMRLVSKFLSLTARRNRR